MLKIEVDHEVLAALTAKIGAQPTSFNDILRQLLGLSAASQPTPFSAAHKSSDLVTVDSGVCGDH